MVFPRQVGGDARDQSHFAAANAGHQHDAAAQLLLPLVDRHAHGFGVGVVGAHGRELHTVDVFNSRRIAAAADELRLQCVDALLQRAPFT